MFGNAEKCRHTKLKREERVRTAQCGRMGKTDGLEKREKTAFKPDVQIFHPNPRRKKRKLKIALTNATRDRRTESATDDQPDGRIDKYALS